MRPIAPVAFTGMPGRFAELFAAHVPGDGLLLLASFLAYAGAHLGRGVHTWFSGQKIYPNLFVVLAGGRIRSIWPFAPWKSSSRVSYPGP